MKKVNLLGIIFSVMLLWILGQPLEAHAETYTWTTNGETVAWYQGYDADETMKMDGAPSEITKDDYIYIFAEPDNACAEFLANLSGEIGGVSIHFDGDTTVVIGKKDGKFSTSVLAISKGNALFYGQVGFCDAFDGKLTILGNVNSLYLGRNTFTSPSVSATVIVNGNVQWVSFVKQRQEFTEQYGGFIGNAEVTGCVDGGSVTEVFYDSALEQNVFAQTGEIQKCEAGTFKVTNGELSENVPIKKKEVSFEYYHMYQCYGELSGYTTNQWVKQYYNKATGSYATQKECTQEDIPEGAKVIIDSTATPVELNVNLSRLEVYCGDVTVNGNISSDYNEVKLPTDGLRLRILSDAIFNVTITGNAQSAEVYYQFNPKCNVFIGGSILNGEYYRYRDTDIDYFDCKNVQLIKDGIWNENVLIKTSLDDDALSYGTVDKETVEDAVADETIGQEIVDGDYTIFKDVETTIKQTAQDIIDSIAKADDFKDVLESIIEKLEETVEEVLDAKPICAVDISIDSFYRDKSTGNVYTANPTYGKENISELPQGNTLEFSVKVPKVHYKEDAKYTIVRQHENADGSVAMEQLETTQNGDILTFESDKFSTFVIVEVTEKVDTTIEIKNADGTVVKIDGIFGDGTYSLENLTAGTYTVKVARENYVSRTYTIEIEDSEIVEIEVKLHKLGDITGDGVINARDKKTLFNHIAGTSKLTDYAFEVADVNGDGVINARDKKMVFNHIAGTNSLWK